VVHIQKRETAGSFDGQRRIEARDVGNLMFLRNPLLWSSAFIVLILVTYGADHSARAESSVVLRQISVRLNLLPGAEHAFLYLGKQKGWYAEQGIDLEVVPGQGSTVTVKTVGSGEDQFAIADTWSVARGWEAGLPLVYVAMLLKHTPAAIFSLPSHNIVTMRDLCGKKVGINLRSTTVEQYHAMVRLAELDCPQPASPTIFATNTGSSSNIFS
jgi:ABC-type nitrate/sulfonate/bicarbonate transport system substrate-binding protein